MPKQNLIERTIQGNWYCHNKVILIKLTVDFGGFNSASYLKKGVALIFSIFYGILKYIEVGITSLFQLVIILLHLLVIMELVKALY